MSEPLRDPDEAAQDAAWREIIANFGERVQLAEDEAGPVETPARFDDDVDESFAPDEDDYETYDDEERFVAPRPSLPRPTPDRFLAWLGVLGAPVAAVLLFVAHVSFGWWIPTWVVDGLVIAFLAGFGYLVLAMPREPREPWDDGARL